MGLFDFVGDIGKKIFSKEEEASAAVTNHINEDNPGVADVAVKVENGVAKISGVASSADALEKAVLMAGNIIGISNVNIDDVTVKNGESLWKIAEKHYGDGNKYTAIVTANKEVIKDADKIFPGQKIRLPKSL